jgi:O-antigen/teichoic acid export membrane protein
MFSLRRGFAWKSLSQAVMLLVALLMVPLVIERLGIAAYGALTLAQSAMSLLGGLDGGLVNAATRNFGIAAGANDRKAAADYFVTGLAAVLTIGCVLGAALFLLAGDVTGLFDVDRALRPQLVYALRVVAVLLPLGLVGSLLSAPLNAHGQFSLTAGFNVVATVAYVGFVVILLHHKQGVETMMRILLLLQCLRLLLVTPWALRHINPLRGRLLPLPEFRALIAYAGQVQAAALTAMVNLQTDALIVGAVLPLRYVALYGVGASLAAELRTVPLNVAAPLIARLTQLIGRGGVELAFSEYVRIQRLWVVTASGFACVAIGASAFQIDAWLGYRFLAAGIVSMLLQVGYGVNLLTMPLTVYLQAIGRPDLDLRYGLLSAALNLICTAALIWVGLYGIAAGTAIGAAGGSLTLLWMAHRYVSTDLPSFFEPVPWTALLTAGIVSAGAGAGLLALTPGHGPLQLLIVSLCMVPGACAFLIARLGVRVAGNTVASAVRSRSATPLIASLGG